MVRHIGFTSAAAIAAATMVVVAAPADAQRKKKNDGGMKLSKAVQPLLVQAQTAQQAEDHATAMQALDQAEALPEKTDDDVYMINALRLNSALALKDNAAIEKAIDGALASGKVPPEEQPKFIRNSGALALQRNDFAKATAQFERLLQLTPEDAELMVEVAQLQHRQKQSQKAVQTMMAAIAQQEKATGAKADESWYRRALGMAYDAKLPAESRATSLALVKAYPNATNWRDSLTIFREGGNFDDQMNLDVLRLARANSALTGERDYAEYAETAALRGFPGEAKAVLDEGVQKGALKSDRPFVKELTASVTPRIASDRSSLPQLEKEVASAKDGRSALGTADAYLGYGDFAKAASLYKTALQKGGVNADIVNTRLGFALAKTGDKAGAEAAFNAVQAEPRKQLAEYWLVWLSQQA